MKITIPFVYQAEIIKPRCRKASTVYVKDIVSVEIVSIDSKELPIAFKIGKSELRWDGERLWDYYYETNGDNGPEIVTGDTIKTNTENGGKDYRWSCSSAKAPFHNFWHRMNSRLDIAWLKDKDVFLREEITYREWVSDNREEVIEKAKNIAADLLLCDGFLYKPVGEPYYNAMLFGLGNNHGGTALFVEQNRAPEQREGWHFNALDYDKALTHTEEKAKGRGDTRSLPMKLNGDKIEVLIKEAVKHDFEPKGLILRQYHQGEDADTILCDGEEMTTRELIARLRALEDVRAIIYDAPELNPSNYDDVDAYRLNNAVIEAWSTIEKNV